MRNRMISAIGLLTFVAVGAWSCYAGPPPDGYVATSGVIVVAPPDLPAYDQPPCPADGYVWTPGYWAWDGAYYWVPGTWVQPPEVGFFWTPGYWGWGGGAYVWHEGYWGQQVGFYGGINYGYGYPGHGYEGGRWDNGHFYYNQSVNNVNVNVVHNVYNTTVVNNVVVNNTTRISYNGGNGGVNASPTAEEEAAGGGRHIPPVAAQTQQVSAARSNPELRASANQGKPAIAATSRPGAFNGAGVVAASEAGTVHNPPSNNGPVTNTVVHPKDLPPNQYQAPKTGDAKLDQQYQLQNQKLAAQQNQEREELQKKQDAEHARLDQQHADAVKTQQLEQKHQQQTQALAEKQNKQWQVQKDRQQPPAKDQHASNDKQR